VHQKSAENIRLAEPATVFFSTKNSPKKLDIQITYSKISIAMKLFALLIQQKKTPTAVFTRALLCYHVYAVAVCLPVTLYECLSLVLSANKMDARF